MTETAKALYYTRTEDIPLARNDTETFVMVYTDGYANGAMNLTEQSLLLHDAVTRVYAFGIGSGANIDQLKV